MTRPVSGGRRLGGWMLPIALLSVLAGILSSGVMVWRASEAAFSGITTNPSNSWTAGTVALEDDDGGSDPLTGTAMFTATGLTPATAEQQKCIVVTYQGNVSAPVKLYGAALGGTGLGTYLNLTIQRGSGGSFADCTGFSSSATIFSDTLATFAGTYTNYSNGLATGWTPTTAGQTAVFRFSYTVADNNTANGKTCSMPFTWEAQA